MSAKIKELKRLLDLGFISYEEYYNREVIEKQLKRREIDDDLKRYLRDHYVVVSSEHYKKRKQRVRSVTYRYNTSTLHTQPIYKLFNLEIDIEFENDERELVKGFLDIDHTNAIMNVESIRCKCECIEAKMEGMAMEQEFKDNYLGVLRKNLLIALSVEEIVTMMIHDYHKLQHLRSQLTSKLVKTFVVTDVVERYEIINLLIIMSNERDINTAKLLYKFARDIRDKKSDDLMDFLSYEQQRRMEMIVKREEEEAVVRELSYEEKLQLIKDERMRRIVESKLKEYNKGKGVTESSSKAEKFLNGFFSIPFGVNKNAPIFDEMKSFRERVQIKMKKYERDNFYETLYHHDHFRKERDELLQIRARQRAFIQEMEEVMDGSVYGHQKTKHHIKRIIAQMLNGNQKGNIIGLKGAPGIGKTSLVREGISKVLGREFSMITLGGISDGSYLSGHTYTYLGSHWGRIVEILMECKCMNPIIYIDELDKVSKTPNGEEIIGILTHATDTSQNSEFYDKYFSGIPIDLSNVVFIFSYNDTAPIDKILLDRINEIEMDFLTADEKRIILHRYTIPKSLATLQCPATIHLSDDIIDFIIHEYNREGGMRRLNKMVDMLLQDANLRVVRAEEAAPHFDITRDYVIDVLRDYRAHIDLINPTPTQIGVINGLYATNYGYGGITQIQCTSIHSMRLQDVHTAEDAVAYSRDIVEKKISSDIASGNHNSTVEMTGSAGAVMQESVRCAHVLVRSRHANAPSMHLNFTNTGQPKDGASAGVAIYLAMHSCIHRIPISHDVACTGEVDILGNVYKIGGLKEKLYGGYRAGVRTFIVPRDNVTDSDDVRHFLSTHPDAAVHGVTTVDDAIALLKS